MGQVPEDAASAPSSPATGERGRAGVHAESSGGGPRGPWAITARVLLSLVGGALLLWFARSRLALDLWPERLVLVRPDLLGWAALLHAPYAYARSVRSGALLDPVVARASHDGRGRVGPWLLHGSGFVGFFVILVLPLRLGELSRPLLLARAGRPGLGLAEAVSATAAERVIDGLAVLALLFGGVAWAVDPAAVDARALAAVIQFGRVMVAVFGLAGLGLLVLARRPEQLAAAVRRVWPARWARGGGRPLAAVLARLAAPLQGPGLLRVLAWTGLYWGVTVAQLWLVAAACGLPLGFAGAAATVAIVGLSIQLPGGPAQAGSFQVGMGMALALLVPPAAVASAGSSFAFVMYLLQLGGGAVFGALGAGLLAVERRARAAHPGR